MLIFSQKASTKKMKILILFIYLISFKLNSAVSKVKSIINHYRFEMNKNSFLANIQFET